LPDQNNILKVGGCKFEVGGCKFEVGGCKHKGYSNQIQVWRCLIQMLDLVVAHLLLADKKAVAL